MLIAVPNIVFARDVDGDFVADEKEVLFSGFDIGNPQHLAAGLTWGLDNWVHIGHGQGEGGILSHKTGVRMNMNGRDLKINPDTGEMAATSGQTQYRDPGMTMGIGLVATTLELAGTTSCLRKY